MVYRYRCDAMDKIDSESETITIKDIKLKDGDVETTIKAFIETKKVTKLVHKSKDGLSEKYETVIDKNYCIRVVQPDPNDPDYKPVKLGEIYYATLKDMAEDVVPTVAGVVDGTYWNRDYWIK